MDNRAAGSGCLQSELTTYVGQGPMAVPFDQPLVFVWLYEIPMIFLACSRFLSPQLLAL